MKNKIEYTPPKLAESFLLWFLKAELAEEVLGDLEESFAQQISNNSPFRAKLNYWYQVFHYLRPFAIRSNIITELNPFFMFRHNFKISFRSLLKDRGYSFINISGLALGMSVALLIGLWINDEFSQNKYHKNYDRIAAVLQNQTFNGEVKTDWNQARQLGTVLRDNYGHHFKHVVKSSFGRGMQLSVGEEKVEIRGQYMEPGAPDLLSLKMLNGQRNGLEDQSSIFIAQSVASKLFKDQNPLGQTLKIDNEIELKVSGVYEDLPFSSSFYKTEFLAPWDFYIKRFNLEKRTGWGNSWFQTFVEINEGTDMATISANIKDAKLIHASSDGDHARFKPEIFLHPMSNWHLYNDFENGKNSGGDIQYVWMFGIIGVFILFLAGINFVNLSTARSERRAKEVGVRKTLGSYRSQLITQFFSESFLVTGIAFFIALALVQLGLPTFNEVAEKEILMPWNQTWFWLANLSFCFLIGFFAGLYPALYLSSFDPVKVLKGTLQIGRWAKLPRQTLVVVQFTVSVALIIGTLIVFQQIQFVKNRPIGYDNNNLIILPIQTDEMNDKYQLFRQDLLNTGMVEAVAKSESPITSTGVTNSGFSWQGKDPNMSEEFSTLRVTHDFGKVIKWNIKEGRDFLQEMASDSMAFVINEAAADYMNMKDPVGQKMEWSDDEIYTIVGVIENMVTQNPYQEVNPMLFFIDYNRSFNANIRLHPNAVMSEVIPKIETIFKKYDPANSFSYTFADEAYAKKFKNEERVGKMAGFFSLLAIIISCLGIFGLATFIAERRSKEISIRKVLGASTAHIWQMLSKEFVLLVLISCIIAIPVSLFYLQRWLDNFVYRTEVPWWIFVLASASALLITLITVSFQSIKAALANPAQILKTE